MGMKTKKYEIVAIIPARGGSKGLPRKNILNLGGIPLVAWSIRACLASSLITRVLVSTEDDEIAEIAKKFGAEVPFLRPEGMSIDDSTVTPAISHLLSTLNETENYAPDFHVILYPTSPFRKVETIDALIRKAIEGYHPVSTVKAVHISSWELHSPTEDGFLKPIISPLATGGDTVRYIRGSGYLSVSNVKSAVPKPYHHILKDKIEQIDIDEAKDLALAELVLNEGLFKREY